MDQISIWPDLDEICAMAIRSGNVECIDYMIECGAVISARIMPNIVYGNLMSAIYVVGLCNDGKYISNLPNVMTDNLNLIKYVKSLGYNWDCCDVYVAISIGRLDILMFILESIIIRLNTDEICDYATGIKNITSAIQPNIVGRYKILLYLINSDFPAKHRLYICAIHNKNLELVDFLWYNGCPWTKYVCHCVSEYIKASVKCPGTQDAKFAARLDQWLAVVRPCQHTL